MNPYFSTKSNIEILHEIEDRIHCGWRLELDLQWMIEKLRELL
jgi:hypothetical protein